MANSKTEKKTAKTKTAPAQPVTNETAPATEQKQTKKAQKVAKTTEKTTTVQAVEQPVQQVEQQVVQQAVQQAVQQQTEQAPVVKAPKNMKVKKAQKTATATTEGQQGGAKPKRHFKCIMINEHGQAICAGRYSGKKPKQAGSKACTRIYEQIKERAFEAFKAKPENANMSMKDLKQKFAGVKIEYPATIIFGMHECTRKNPKKKKYFYSGQRVRLEEPEEVPLKKIDPKTGKNVVIKYNFNNNVKKLTKEQESSNEYKVLSNYDVVDEPEDQQEGGAEVKVAKKATKRSTSKNASKRASSKKGSKKQAPKKTAKKTAKTQAKRTVVKKAGAIKVKKSTKTAGKTAKPKAKAVAKSA